MSVFYITSDVVKPLTMQEIIRLARCFQSTTPMQDLQALEDEFYVNTPDLSCYALDEQTKELQNTLDQQQQQQHNKNNYNIENNRYIGNNMDW